MWYRLFLLKDVVNHNLWQLNYRKQTETRASHSAVVPQVEAGARSFVFFWSFVSSGTWGKPIDHRYAARKSRVNKDSQLRNGASSSEHQIFYKSVDSIAGTRRLKKKQVSFFLEHLLSHRYVNNQTSNMWGSGTAETPEASHYIFFSSPWHGEKFPAVICKHVSNKSTWAWVSTRKHRQRLTATLKD